jgi:hypothetical protein
MSTEVKALLKINPYSRESSLNLSGTLRESEFIGKIYQEYDDTIEKNIYFNQDFRKSIIEVINSKHSHVLLMHLVGYAGSGKTTYIRKVIYDLSKQIKLIYYNFSYQKTHTVLVNTIITGLIDSYELIDKKPPELSINQLDLSSFDLQNHKGFRRLLTGIYNDLYNIKQKRIDRVELKEKFYRQITRYISALSHDEKVKQLLTLDFIFTLLFEQNACIPGKKVMVFFDNLDSMDDERLEEEFFHNICWFVESVDDFYDANSKLFFEKNCENIGLLTVLTTRLSTALHHQDKLDSEFRIGAPVYCRMAIPEAFYNTTKILRKRIKYLLEVHKDFSSTTRKLLFTLSEFLRIELCHQFTREFVNMNYNVLVDRYIDILENAESRNTVLKTSSFISANKFSSDMKYFITKSISTYVFLSVLFRSGVFSNKPNNSSKIIVESVESSRISLFKMLLTFINERCGYCTLAEIRDGFPIYYTDQELADCLYRLSEAKRDKVRRMITFYNLMPKTKDDVLAVLCDSRKDTIGVSICISGQCFIDYIAVNFDFILLSNRISVQQNTQKLLYLEPLFLNSQISDIEAQIRIVICSLKKMADNEKEFATKLVDEYNIRGSDYRCSNYNYTTKDREIKNKMSYSPYYAIKSGFKQSHTARAVFSCVGYVERLRRALLFQNANSEDKVEEINYVFVKIISELLTVYNQLPDMLKSERQDHAFKGLKDKTLEISSQRYRDNTVEIEIGGSLSQEVKRQN